MIYSVNSRARSSIALQIGCTYARPQRTASSWTWVAVAEFAYSKLDCNQLDETRQQFANIRHLVCSAAGYLFRENCCFVFLNPVNIHFDDAWRLHAEREPAVEFEDGSRMFHWHGVEMSEEFVLNPHKAKIKDIENEGNVERRRAMIDCYGIEKFIKDSGCRIAQKDAFGILYRKEMKSDEPLVVVRVINSTPEPDGSFKNYFLRVPSGVKTAREAVAWTFRMEEEEYKPEQES